MTRTADCTWGSDTQQSLCKAMMRARGLVWAVLAFERDLEGKERAVLTSFWPWYITRNQLTDINFLFFLKQQLWGPFLWHPEHTDFFEGVFISWGTECHVHACVHPQAAEVPFQTWLKQKEQLRLAALFTMASEFPFFFPFIWSGSFMFH